MRVCDIPQKPAELAPPVKTQKREAGLALFFHPSNHYPKSTTSRFSSKQKNPTATTSQCKEWEEWSNLVGSSELWKISSKNGIVVARIAFCCNAPLLHPSQSRWHRGDSHSPWLRVASFSAPFDESSMKNSFDCPVQWLDMTSTFSFPRSFEKENDAENRESNNQSICERRGWDERARTFCIFDSTDWLTRLPPNESVFISRFHFSLLACLASKEDSIVVVLQYLYLTIMNASIIGSSRVVWK